MTDENTIEDDFYSKIEKYASDPPERWNHVSLLSYFLCKYKSINGIDFIFSPSKNGPLKSKELKDALKIYSAFDRGRYKRILDIEQRSAYKEQLVNIIKTYIDWAFEIKMRGKPVNITGLGLLAVSNFMNEFLQWHKAKKLELPKRNALLPASFINWVNLNMPEIFEKQQLKVLDNLNALYNYVEAYDKAKISIEALILDKAKKDGIFPISGKLELGKK